MKVFYDTGYPVQRFGDAGEFKLGEPRDIPDDLAQTLIKKGRLKPYPESVTRKPKGAAPADEAKEG